MHEKWTGPVILEIEIEENGNANAAASSRLTQFVSVFGVPLTENIHSMDSGVRYGIGTDDDPVDFFLFPEPEIKIQL